MREWGKTHMTIFALKCCQSKRLWWNTNALVLKQFSIKMKRKKKAAGLSRTLSESFTGVEAKLEASHSALAWPFTHRDHERCGLQVGVKPLTPTIIICDDDAKGSDQSWLQSRATCVLWVLIKLYITCRNTQTRAHAKLKVNNHRYNSHI